MILCVFTVFFFGMNIANVVLCTDKIVIIVGMSMGSCRGWTTNCWEGTGVSQNVVRIIQDVVRIR